MSDECRMCEKQDWDTKEPVGLWKRARRTSPGTAPHYPHSHTTHQDLVRGSSTFKTASRSRSKMNEPLWEALKRPEWLYPTTGLSEKLAKSPDSAGKLNST